MNSTYFAPVFLADAKRRGWEALHSLVLASSEC